ncbi:MAG TPA: efflux transporter outer membrane subunit [Synergistaceae bacterium]|nr:efflux transporter outer membrane subunit [Synergistaceae bacterium]
MKKLTALMAALLLLMGGSSLSAARENTLPKDLELELGKWADLAKRYPMPYFASPEVPDAPAPEVLARWWDFLGDDTLTKLILLSLENNRDIRTARSKFAEARAALGISKSAVLPWIDGSGSFTNLKSGENANLSGQQVGPVDLYKLGIDASWEIDFSGAQALKIEASAADLQAQYGALHSAWVSLSSEVALNYLSLRTLQKRLLVAKKNLSLQLETVELLQSKYDSGLADELDLSQAKYTMEQTKSTIPPIRAGMEEAMNRLAILVGEVPGSLSEDLSEYRPLSGPEIDLVGIPADFLRQRPDIFMAERQLVAQIARKDAAKKDFIPKLLLFGSIGLESYGSASGLSISDGGLYSISPQISWPIFHGGAIRKNIQVQTERQEQALAAYEQTVLNAVAEVRNALTAETQERERNESLQRGVTAATTAMEVAEDQYNHGLKDFNNVIIAQSALLRLEEQLAISDGQMLSNLIQIFKALGGGWAPMEEYLPVQAKILKKEEPRGTVELSDESQAYLDSLRKELEASE